MSVFDLFDLYARIFFTVLLPLLLVAAVLLIWLNLRKDTGRNAPLLVTAGAAAFLLGDLLLVAALPVLGVSFGKNHFNTAAFFSIRFALYLLWLGLRLRRPAGTGPFWTANGLVTLVMVYGFILGPTFLTVSRVQVETQAVTRPVRIVQLSDIHMERSSLRDQRLPELVAELQPDIIVLTGDYLSTSYLNDPRAKADMRALAQQLEAPLGVFAVQGTVDNQPDMHRLFDGTNVQILHNQMAEITQPGVTVDVLGISDWGTPREELALLAPQLRAESFHLLLYHTPDMIELAADHGIDLYLAGHTHGGQIRLPVYGAIVTFSDFGKRYEMGRYQVGETILYVSRGLGMEGYSLPRVRFLAPPEVVVVDLVPPGTGED